MVEFKKSICQVLYQKQIIGTGFFIGKGKIVTAAHVVDTNIKVQVSFNENDTVPYIYDCELQEQQPDTDICILIFDESQNGLKLHALKYSLKPALANSEFISYGYPGENQGNMSYICGKIINTHDGVVDSQYTADLEVLEGKLSNYEGFSGAPIIVKNEVVGICTYQCSDQLRLVEFCKNIESLKEALGLNNRKEKNYISNIPVYYEEDDYISRQFLLNEIESHIIETKSSIIAVRGCSGIGKTTWIEQLENTKELIILGKYFVDKTYDSLPVVYRKSEEALYDWFCMMGNQFALERLEASRGNGYKERLDSTHRILQQLDEYLDSIDKQGLICIDGLDSFVNDDIRVFELFCSYFSTYTSKRIHVILTLNNEKVLPLSVKNKITDDDIFDMGLFSIIAIRDFLLRKLVINDVEKYVEQIAEKSEGHALYLHYIIESVNHLSQDEDVAFFIEKFPAYGGDIRKYYDYKWDEIKKKESNVKLVSYLARVRISLDKQILFQMVPAADSIAFDIALDNMNGLLIQDTEIGFFHSSFQQYVCDHTEYLNQEVHHLMALYCLEHQDTDYGTTQLLYHLSNGTEEDKKQCISECNQQWMNKCGELGGGPEVMLQDMRMVLGLCCSLGEFAQLIDKLLLMQRAQTRYDEMFARFAADLAMVEIERGHPQKALEYLYRYQICIVSDEDLLACLYRMICKEQWECAYELVSRMETEIIKAFQVEESVSIAKICVMIRAYQMVALSGSSYFYKKMQLFLKLIYSQELDDFSAAAVMQASCDYNLWKNGAFATAERLEENNLTMNQAVYDNWLLSVIGSANLENITGEKSKSWEALLEEIRRYDTQYLCDERIKKVFIDVCMIRKGFAVLLNKEDIAKFSPERSLYFRAANGVDVDYTKVYNTYSWHRNQAYLGKEVEDISLYKGVWSKNWEDGLTRLVSCVGKYYGLGLLRSDKADVDALKKILENSLFSFDERTEFRDAYDIPEKVMEYITPSIAKYFIILYPGEKMWFLSYVKAKALDQFGVYYESYIRIMLHIIQIFQQEGAVDEIVDVIKMTFHDITLKVANRFERTEWLLKIVNRFFGSGCVDLAENAYSEVLKSSMGPLWYKEAQYSLLEESIENLCVKDINENVVRQSMVILDAASGGMTFERYIRTSKESLIEKLWKIGKYSMAIKCMKLQLLPEDWQAEIMSNYEPVDKKKQVVGNYRVSNCIFPQRMMSSILEDSNIPEDFKWAFSEIFMLVERRNFRDYIRIQAEILAKSGKQKKRYYDRILNILVCDVGEYYFHDILDLYQQYVSEDELQVILELLEEYIGVVETRKIPTEKMEQVDVEENRKHVEGDEKEKLFLPGTFGKRASIKKANKIWNEIKNEEKKGNISQIRSKCIEIIKVEEDGGWPIWNHGADKSVGQSLEKLIELSEKPQEAMSLLKDFIMAPKYSARWQIAEKLLVLSENLVGEDEKLKCYEVIVNHYKEMMNIPEKLIDRYCKLKDEEMTIEEACFAMLLGYIVYPQHYISQKSMELFSWVMACNEKLVPLLVKYSWSDNLEIAEVCSSYCLKLSEQNNRVLMKELEKIQNLRELIIKNQWMIVKGNMYLVIKKYKERSTKLKECFESISKEIIKSNTNCEMVAITNELKKMQIINQKYHCMDERFFQIISKTAQMQYELLDNDAQEKFEQYVERLCAGFHDSSLKQVLWRSRWYGCMNGLEYQISDEKKLQEVLNALRRVNWSFPVPEANNNYAKKYFYSIKKMLLDSDSRLLNKIFGGEKNFLAYQGINLKGNNIETISIRAFLVEKQITEEELLEIILTTTMDYAVDDYSLESAGIHTSAIKEISYPWIPGAIIGFNISSKMLNLGILAEVGITNNEVHEGVFIGQREWREDFGGRPSFNSAFGNVNISNMQYTNGQKLIAYMEYRADTIVKGALVNFREHKVIYC